MGIRLKNSPDTSWIARFKLWTLRHRSTIEGEAVLSKPAGDLLNMLLWLTPEQEKRCAALAADIQGKEKSASPSIADRQPKRVSLS